MVRGESGNSLFKFTGETYEGSFKADLGDKMLTPVASALAGGDCIDDADVLRTGGTAGVLDCVVKAPSTLGTFLRSFRWGHMSVSWIGWAGSCWHGPGRPSLEHPQGLCLDKGYDFAEVRRSLDDFGFTAHIRSRGEEEQAIKKEAGFKARRWVVERTHSWLNRFRRIWSVGASPPTTTSPSFISPVPASPSELPGY